MLVRIPEHGDAWRLDPAAIVNPLARLGLWPQRRFGMPAGIEQHQHGADAMTVRHRQEGVDARQEGRSEEHTSELQSLMRISYAVFCLKKKNNKKKPTHMSRIHKKLKDESVNTTHETLTE